MKDLEVRLQANGNTLQGHSLDMGDWDLAEGGTWNIFLHNPNEHAKGVLSALKNMNALVKLEIPSEIRPLETIPLIITIPPHTYMGEEDEKAFFDDMVDALVGKITWRKA